MGFVEVSIRDELKDGNMKMTAVDGREILIARVGDNYYAADNRCPHMGGNLSHGKLEGTVVTCPRHHSQFDLTDGHVIRWTDWSGLKLSVGKLLKSPRPLKTHEVKVEGEKILVDLK
jgi:3-phenylpropionate/trans-cinnamate dioxygenase ferredoxin subunit